MRKFLILLAPMALLLAMGLAGCGNKGPLVRPSAADIEDASLDADAGESEPDATDAEALDDDASPPPETDVP